MKTERGPFILKHPILFFIFFLPRQKERCSNLSPKIEIVSNNNSFLLELFPIVTKD